MTCYWKERITLEWGGNPPRRITKWNNRYMRLLRKLAVEFAAKHPTADDLEDPPEDLMTAEYYGVKMPRSIAPVIAERLELENEEVAGVIGATFTGRPRAAKLDPLWRHPKAIRRRSEAE